jgi:hypothetical protein
VCDNKLLAMLSLGSSLASFAMRVAADSAAPNDDMYLGACAAKHTHHDTHTHIRINENNLFGISVSSERVR